ncbi:7900_t:CDS:2, partial [Diversispora eburnea]
APRLSLLILPTETLLQITSYLGIIHLKQLSLTNRFLCTLISPYRFKSVIGYNISLFFLRTIVLKYGQYFKSLTLQGQISQEFINRLADLLKILDTHCDRLEVFNIIVYEQTPGILELNPPNFTQKLYRKKLKFLRFTCSTPLITYLAPIYFPPIEHTSKIEYSNFSIHAVIQSVWSLNHYSELYGSQITRAHLSFEGLSNIWISQLIDTCNLLQELILERIYNDDNIEITDSILNDLCTLSNLTSLAFISNCDVALTRWFTCTGWKRMLSGTPKLERLDISGLGSYFTCQILPLIAENYKSRPLW